jgi:hypothetical protein
MSRNWSIAVLINSLSRSALFSAARQSRATSARCWPRFPGIAAAHRIFSSPGWRSPRWRSPGWRLPNRATAALEFAIATPLLVIMLGGAADFGLAQFYRTNLANAVAAGCQYAYLITQNGGTVTTANVQNVILNAMFLPAGAIGNLSVVVTGPRGYCVVGTGPTMSAATVPSTCTDGSAAGTYIIVQATYTNTGLMRGFMSVKSQPITESATARLN